MNDETPRSTRVRLFLRLLAATVLAATVAGAGASLGLAKPDVPDVPAEIAVDDGQMPYLSGHAVGVQIYRCASTATGPAWTFVAPRADVYDDKGMLLMTHYAGPTWQSTDGSIVVGAVAERAPVAGSIPWLLLEAVDTSPGRLLRTTFIQRIATTGGLAPPASECTGDTLGTIDEIPYTADYVFWKATGS